MVLTYDLEAVYDTFIKGFKAGKDLTNFNIESRETCKIAGKDAMKLKYNTEIKGMYADCELYVIVDVEKNTLYTLIFGARDKVSSSLQDDIDGMINSIRDRH